mgnify:CR=1 FL=1
MIEERYLIKFGNAYFAIPDEVIDEIRSDEREMIVDFLRTDEWKYECCEDGAAMIEELGHYEDEELH